MKRIFFVLVSLCILFLFATCSVDPTADDGLIGTVWEYAVLGTGSQLHFTSATEGEYYTILLSEPIFGWGFDYTYDGSTSSGQIDNEDFTVNENGKELTYGDVIYKYKPFGK